MLKWQLVANLRFIMKTKVKQLFGWMIILILVLIFLWLSMTGRLGILASIAIYPDQVAYTGS
jgi:hypothetical protein